jgi:hypothetical protein
MLKYQVIEAIEEYIGDKEVAFRLSNIIKHQRFTDLDGILDDNDINFLKREVL